VIGEVENYNEGDILAKKSVVSTSSVRTGQFAGTVAGHASKVLGKQVTEALEDDELNGTTLAIALEKAGLEYFSREEVAEIANDCEYKRAGKKVAHYLDSGAADITKFEAALKEVLEAAENDVCPRCGADLDGEDECGSCGYYL
jgi:hypothetical protein